MDGSRSAPRWRTRCKAASICLETSFRGVTRCIRRRTAVDRAAGLLAGQEIGLVPPALPTNPVNQGTRNGPVNYNFPNMKLSASHVQPYQTNQGAAAVPLVNTLPRSSALRSLGGLPNCFANESFMDELALAANADPIAFRKKYVCAL